MYQTFFCIFQTNLALATLGLKEMEKFLWEGREKVLPSWLSQFSFAKQTPPCPLNPMALPLLVVDSLYSQVLDDVVRCDEKNSGNSRRQT